MWCSEPPSTLLVSLFPTTVKVSRKRGREKLLIIPFSRNRFVFKCSSLTSCLSLCCSNLLLSTLLFEPSSLSLLFEPSSFYSAVRISFSLLCCSNLLLLPLCASRCWPIWLILVNSTVYSLTSPSTGCQDKVQWRDLSQASTGSGNKCVLKDGGRDDGARRTRRKRRWCKKNKEEETMLQEEQGGRVIESVFSFKDFLSWHESKRLNLSGFDSLTGYWTDQLDIRRSPYPWIKSLVNGKGKQGTGVPFGRGNESTVRSQGKSPEWKRNQLSRVRANLQSGREGNDYQESGQITRVEKDSCGESQSGLIVTIWACDSVPKNRSGKRIIWKGWESQLVTSE